jgi:phage terminase small subunit
MGQRGPIPLEKKDKALRANTSGRPITEAVKAPGRILPAPAWMSDDQREVWKETVRHAPRNLLARIDAGILATYVVHRHAYECIAAMCEGKPWDLARHADVLSKHQSAMLKASAALGLDPAARARLRIDSDAPVNPSAAAATLFDALKEA